MRGLKWLSVFLLGLGVGLASGREGLASDPLAAGQLQILGNRLTIYHDGQVNDAEQTLNVGEAAAVRTCYGGADAPCGSLDAGDPRVAGLLVLAELHGPELPEPIPFQTVPGGTFSLPGFQQEGDYWLANIRLVRADTRDLVGLAEPSAAVLHVRQILLASATVTRLTLADLEARGITLSQENFQAYNFAVGFALQGSTVTIEMPVVFEGTGFVSPLSSPSVNLEGVPDHLRPIVARWQPPSIVPFRLEVKGQPRLVKGEDVGSGPPQFPLYGAIVLPGTISFLNQFFDARLIVANGAPADSAALLSNVSGTLRLPAGNVVRLAQTDPPVLAGQAVPVIGASGERTLIAGAQGTASWTVEGLVAGSHALRIDITGDLERPGRPILPLTGSVQAAVEVVDARFHLTFGHPRVVREQEPYSLYVTVTNMSRARQNLIAVEIKAEHLTGAHKADPADTFRRQIEFLDPGQSETLEFPLVADITGEVVATTYQASSVNAQGSILLRTGVGLLGIPLSPASLVLPRFSDRLKTPYLPSDTLHRATMRFLGLAYSLAVAPAGTAPRGLPRVIKRDVERHAIDFAEAGQRTWLGEDSLRSLEVMTLDLLGNRHPQREMDGLRRAIGQELGALSQASALAEQIRALQIESNLGAEALLDHLAETASYCEPFIAAILVPAGGAARPELEIRANASAGPGRLLNPSDHAAPVRSLPFAESFAVLDYPGGPASAELAIVGRVVTSEAEGLYELVLHNRTESSRQGRLVLVVPDGETQEFRRVDLGVITVPARTSYVVMVGASVPTNGGFGLTLPGGSPVAGAPSPWITSVPRPDFRVIGSRQDFTVDHSGYSYGMGVTYLFNRPPYQELVQNPSAFAVKSTFAGLDVNGQPASGVSAKTGRALFFQDDERVVIVRYSSPISALVDAGTPLVSHEHELSHSEIRDRWGDPLSGSVSPPLIEMAPLHTGGLLDGQVVHGTGQPAAGATVQLIRARKVGDWVYLDVVGERLTGADGRFYFDFIEDPIRAANIEPLFTIRASVPAGADPVLEPAQVAEVSSSVRLYNRLAHLNVALLGRGHVTGHLRYLGGGPVPGGTVTATSMLFRETKTVNVDAAGAFRIGGMPVGPITLTGTDPDNWRVFATIGIERPGETVDVDLQILRREEEPPTFGEVRGTVLLRRQDGSTEPVAGARVEVYAQGGSVGSAETTGQGEFWFADVPTGRVAVQAAHWAVSRNSAFTELDLSEGQVAQVALTLVHTPIRTVVGRVLLADPVGGGTTPVQGAPVFIEGPGTYTYSQADGSFRLDGVPGQPVGQGPYTLTAIDTQRRLEGKVVLPLILSDSPEVITAPDIVLKEMTGGVDGIVLDPLGRPYGGVSVVVFPFAEKPAGSDGRFSFEDITVGRHKVVVHAGDGLIPGRVGYFGEAGVNVVFAGHRPFVTVRLRGSGIVNVLTKTATSPGVMSIVRYRPTYYSGREYEIKGYPEYIETSTNDLGQLQLNLPVGHYEIIVYNPFHGLFTIHGEVEYNGQVRSHEIVFGELSTVRGVVVDVDGVTPVPGAEVLMATSTLLPQQQLTDALGRFQYELVPPGQVTVTARATVGTVERVGVATTGSMDPGQTFDITVRLKPQGTVRGQIVERDGEQLTPVPGAKYRLDEHQHPFRRIPGSPQTWSFADSEGRFSISGVNAGGFTVTAQHPTRPSDYGYSHGTITTDWEVVELPPIEIRNDVASILLTVRDPGTGAPVPDVQVTLDPTSYPLPPSPFRAVTDPNGQTRFDAVRLGFHTAYVFHAPTGRSGTRSDLLLSTSGEVLEATLYLDSRGEIRGHLYNDVEKTTPVAGATVRLSGSTVGGGLTALATTSGVPETHGRFQFLGIPVGQFDLKAWTATSPRLASGSVAVTASAPLATVDLVLERLGDLNVRVLEKREGGLVEVDPAQHVLSVSVTQGCFGLPPQCAYSYTQILPVVPSPGHLYGFPGVLADRRVSIGVQEYSGKQRSGSVELSSLAPGSGTPGNPLTVVLGAKGVARVTVRDAQGAPVVGVPVIVAGGVHLTVVTGSDGIATALGVHAGRVTASAVMGGQSGTAAGQIEHEDQILDLTIQLSPAVLAHGVVYQPVPGDAVGDGTVLVPQAQALATLRDAHGATHVAMTGDDGVYRFSGLPVGHFTLEVCDFTCEAVGKASGTLPGPHGSDHELPSFVLDAVPPTVVSIAPPPGIEGVSRMAVVEILFSELLDSAVLPVDGASSYFTLATAGGPPAAGAWSASVANGRHLIRFVPSQPYENLSWYGITIKGGSTGVRDRTGRLLKEFGNVGSSFKTSDTIGPAVIGTHPSLARPVPPLGAIRVDFNEAVVATDEALDGDGLEDAGELFWGQTAGGGEVVWRHYPVVLYLTRSGFSLAVQPHTGIDLTGDTGRRFLKVSRLFDAHNNPMPPWERTFRIYDSRPPVVDMPLPAGAPDGVLSAGTSYALVPVLSELDDLTPENPGGDIDFVEYFLSEPYVGAVPTFASSTYPFDFSFVAAYGGNGTDPWPFGIWVRATDTSTNRSNVATLALQVLPNQPPVVGAVVVAATAPVAGVPYAGSTMHVVVSGLADPDGALLTLNVALADAASGTPVVALPVQSIVRPGSGSWADLGVLEYDLTLPLTVAEGAVLVARAVAIDSKGAVGSADSPTFVVADDQAEPVIEGLIVRRPGQAASSPYFIGQNIVVELRARDAETAISAVSVSFSEHFPPQVATLVPGSGNLYRTPELTVPEISAEVTITATAQAEDHGGNTTTQLTTFQISPTADPYAPVVTWLTPWEGAPWPAGYTSVVTTQAGSWLWLRVRVTDLDLVGGEVSPGTITSVMIRGPVMTASGVELATEWIAARAAAGTGHPDVWELEWLVPNAIPAGSWLPFEVRAADTGANVVTRAVRMQAVASRRVYEGVVSAVLPADPMMASGGVSSGAIFLLDGTRLSLYPQEDGSIRTLSSIFLYSGAEAGTGGMQIRPTVLSVPEVTSPSSPILFYPFELGITDAVGIGHGAAVDVSSRGLLGNSPLVTVALPGTDAAQAGAGGSHGGRGWFGKEQGDWAGDGLREPGSTYDSVRQPRLPGGGGGSFRDSPAGGKGGGVVRLLAAGAVVHLAGEIAARGGQTVPGGSGGGAGGAIFLDVGRLEGAGLAAADGGRGVFPGNQGGGGGGRVAVAYREIDESIDPATSFRALGADNSIDAMFPPTYFGGAGTILLQPVDPVSGQPIGRGHLRIANQQGLPAATTPLPALGAGDVLAVDPASRTITISTPRVLGDMVGELVVVSIPGEDDAVWPITSQQQIQHEATTATRLGVEADETGLQAVSVALTSGQAVTFVGRSHFASVTVTGAARLVTEDDLAVGGEIPAVNDRASISLGGDARLLLRGESPALTVSSDPLGGTSLLVGATVSAPWTAASQIGLRRIVREWTFWAAPEKQSYESQPVQASSSSAAAQVPPTAPPGPATLTVTALDWAGRSSTEAVTWQVLANSPPTGTIAFAAGTPAAVFQCATVQVQVTAQDAEGLSLLAVAVTGSATSNPVTQPVTGVQAARNFNLSVAPDADPGAPISVSAAITDTAGATAAVGPIGIGVLADNEPPVQTVQSVQPGTQVVPGQTITVTIQATDNNGLASMAFNLTNAGTASGQEVRSLSGLSSQQIFFRAIPTDLADGTQVSLEIITTDLCGRAATSTLTFTVLQDLLPTGTIILSPSTQVLPNHTFSATIDTQDDYGLKRIVITLSGAYSYSWGLDLPSPYPKSYSLNRSFRLPIGTPGGGQVRVDATVWDSSGRSAGLPQQVLTVLPDTATPTIQQVSPAANATVSEGQVVSFRFDIQDDVGVETATLVIGGGQPQTLPATTGSMTDTVWNGFVSTTWRAPEVEIATIVPYELTLQDPGGHSVSVQGTLTVNPVSNTTAPKFTLICPGAGDIVVAGQNRSLRFKVSDTDTILDYSIYINGIALVQGVVVNATSKEVTQSWQVPAAVQVGDIFIVRYEARDYAGNVGFAELDLRVPTGQVLSGNQTLEAQYSEPIVLRNGTFTVAGGGLTAPALALVAGAVLQGQNETPLHLDIPGDLVVSCESSIDQSGRGYAGGTAASPSGEAPPEVAGSDPDAGGSHGGLGLGGSLTGAPGEAYDSVFEPRWPGSGASFETSSAGRGGGAVLIDAERTILNGSIEARGNSINNKYGYRAAGGTIRIRGQSLTGIGTINATGAGSSRYYTQPVDGAGGGGRIALAVADLTGFDPVSQTDAAGGCAYYYESYNYQYYYFLDRCAGVGTVFWRTAGDTHGRLRVKQSESRSGITAMPSIGSHAVGLAQPDGEDPSAIWIEPADPTARFDLGVEGMWVRTSAGDFRVTAQESRRRIKLAGAAASIAVGDGFEGIYKLDALTLTPYTVVAFSDTAEIGVLQLNGGTVYWVNLDDPVINLSKISVISASQRFKIVGQAGALSDQTGLSLVRARNLTGGGQVEGSITSSDGSFSLWLPVGWVAPAEVLLTVVDRHPVRPRQSSATLGLLPVNTGAPVLQPSLISITTTGSFGVRGLTGAASDPDGLCSAVATNLTTQQAVTASPGSNGSFTLTGLSGSAGDVIRLAVSDCHGNPMTAALDVGALPANDGPPVVTPSLVNLFASNGGFRVRGQAGAVLSADGVRTLTVRNVTRNTSISYSSSNWNSDGSTAAIGPPSQSQVGDLIRLEVTDNFGAPLTAGADIGTLPANAGPPTVVVGRITIQVAGGAFRIVGQSNAVTDPDGILSCTLRSPARGLDVAVTLSSGGFNVAVPSTWLAGDLVQLEAKDGHPSQLTTVVDLGLLPANAGPPTVDPGKIAILVAGGVFRVVGQSYAVTDPDGIPSCTLRNPARGLAVAVTLSSGGFNVAVPSTWLAGDLVQLEAKDGHPAQQVTLADIGTLPTNAGPPTVNASLVTVGVAQGRYRVMGAAGALVDQDGIANVLIRNVTKGQTTPITIDGSGGFVWKVLPLDWLTGDAIHLEATDRHPSPQTALVDLGALPANAGGPTIDVGKVHITIYLRRFWVTGDVGAVLDPEGVESLTLTNLTRGETLPTTQVFAGGDFNPFQVPADWTGGDALQLAARDWHPNPLTTTTDIGALPVNAGPPAIDANGLHTGGEPPTYSASTFRGHGGTVTDPDQPIEIRLRNLRTLAEKTFTARSDGGFLEAFVSEPGDTIEITASDDHPQSQSTTYNYDRNSIPVVDPNRIQVHYAPPDPSRGLGAGYDVVVQGDAITDDEPPLSLRFYRDSNQDGEPEEQLGAGSFVPGAPAVFRITDNNPAQGDYLLVQVEDSHPGERMWKRVQLGQLPADNYAPVVDANRILLTWIGDVLHFVGDAQAVADPDAPITLTITNQTRPAETTTLSIADGQQFDVEVAGNEGERFTLVATDSRVPPMTTTVVDLGPVPSRTNTPPVITQSRIHYSWVSAAELRLVGDPQAVTDVDKPIHLVATNQTTGTQYTGQAEDDGSFSMVITGEPGEEFRLKATDSHAQALDSEASVGQVPPRANQKPVITVTRLHLRWVEEDLHLVGDPQAVVDPDQPVNLLATNQSTGSTASGQAAADGSFDLLVAGEPGQVFRLAATDSHAQPETEEVEVGTVPERPNTAPAIDTNRISFVPASGSIHLVGQAGAVVDPDQPIHLLATNLETQAEFVGQAAADGSFTLPVEGEGGDEFRLRATDSHAQPLSTEVAVGAVPIPNQEPVIHVDLVHIEWVDGTLWVRGDPGAVEDPDQPVLLLARNVDTDVGFAGQAAANGEFVIQVEGAPGDLFTLTATDGHAHGSLSRTEEIGTVPQRPNTPPRIDRSRIRVMSQTGQPVRILCGAGAIVDSDWPVRVLFINQNQPAHTAETWIDSSEAFELEIQAAVGDYFRLEATDSHAVPLTGVEVDIGPVLPPNDSAPELRTWLMQLVWDADGRLHAHGGAGAVEDPDTPVTVSVWNRQTQREFTTVAAGNGSFDVIVEAEPGHFIVVRATDGHVQPRTSEADLDFVPQRPDGAPRLRLDRIAVINDGSGPLRVEGAAGAVEDEDHPISVTVANLATMAAFTMGVDEEDGSFYVEILGTAGDSLELAVTDAQALTTRVSLGPIPEAGKPALRRNLVYLHPLGAGYQVVGDVGAVSGGDGARTAVVTSESGGTWTSPVLSNGSFRVLLPAADHEQLALIVLDAQGDSTAEVSYVAWVGYSGWYHWGNDSAGHEVSRLIDGRLAILDGGHAITYLVSYGEVSGERVLGDLLAAQDVFFNFTLYPPASDLDEYRNLMALDGGYLVAWHGAGDPLTRTRQQLELTSTGVLKRANTRGRELYVAGEEPSGPRLFRLSVPAFTSDGLAPSCGGAVQTVDLPGYRRVLELISGPDGVVGVVTDDPGAELWLVDVSVPGVVSSLGTVDLAGASAFTWAVWDLGNLLAARSNGAVELWRWQSASSMQRVASWQPPQGTPTSATFIGDQLFVGTDTGTVFQVSLFDPAAPVVLGSSTFDDPIVTMSRKGQSQIVVPAGGLYDDSLAGLPPTVSPERVSWGHGTDAFGNGRTWVTVGANEHDGGWDFDWRVRWPSDEWSRDVWLMERETIDVDFSAPPSVVGVAQSSRVFTAPWAPNLPGWRGFDPPRHPGYALGLHNDPPTGCATDRGVAEGTHTDTLRVIFTATAASGQPDVTYSYLVEGTNERGVATLATNGPVVELLLFHHAIIALDEGLSAWSNHPDFGGNQLEPTPLAGGSIELFGGSAAKAGALNHNRVVAVASSPARVAVVQVELPDPPPGAYGLTVLRHGAAAEDELSDVAGEVIDMTSAWDRLWVLSHNAGVYHLYHFLMPASPSEAVVLVHHVELAPGPAPVAIDLRHSEGTHDEGFAVAIVRQGYGVELRGAELEFLSLTRVPGEPLDFLWGNWLLLGDFGAAELQGPNAAPTPSYVWSNVRSPGRAVHGTSRIATPDGPMW